MDLRKAKQIGVNRVRWRGTCCIESKEKEGF